MSTPASLFAVIGIGLFYTWLTGLFSVAAILLAIGRKQRIEGNGSWSKFFRVVAALSLIATLPLAANDLLDTIFPPGTGLLPSTVVMTVLATLSCIQVIRPIRLIGVRKELPALDDAEIVNRVASLAQRMGLRPPSIRIVRAVASQFSLFAGVSGLQAPSIVIFQGVVDRLEPDERDAILSHELAHLANRSFWYYTLPFPLAGVVTLCLQQWLPALPAVPFAISLGLGLQLIIRRWFEIDCDLRGARVTSFRAMHSALAKVHADHGRGDRSLLSSLAYATATHPHRDVRLASLCHSAPEEERMNLRPPEPNVARHRRLSRLALGVWLLILGYAMIASPSQHQGPESDQVYFSDQASTSSILLLFASIVVPPYLLIFGHRRHTKWEQQRAGIKAVHWWRIAGFAGILFLLILVSPLIVIALVENEMDAHSSLIVLSMFIIVASVLLARRMRKSKLESEMTACLIAHRFEELVTLAGRHPKKVAKNPMLRCWVAGAHAALGDTAKATAELWEIVRDYPKFPPARFALQALLLDQGDVDGALEHAAAAARLLPSDPLPWIEIAHIHRRSGRLEDAQGAITKALQRDPTSGAAEALAAAIALDRGDTERAKQLIEQASEHAPGTVPVRIVAAEIAWAIQSPDAPERIKSALRSIESQPFVPLETEKQQLESWLNELSPPTLALADEAEMATLTHPTESDLAS